MDIDRVQRWVMSTLTLTVAFVWTIGMVLGALFTIDQGRAGSQILIFALATIINLAAVIGVRLINELGRGERLGCWRRSPLPVSVSWRY